MILRRLSVEAFGLISDLALEPLAPGLTVLYGPNEAGKSTLLRALRWLWFARDVLNPPQGAAAVAALVEDASGRAWRVERRVTARSRTGVAAVSALGDGDGDDGAGGSADEVLAGTLLAGTSWPLYRQVFAVGLADLEDAAGLEASEVAGALYSAGAVGAADLAAVERQLTAEADGLFRPRATRSVVNVALRRLDDARGELAEARRREEAVAERLADRPRLAEAEATGRERARAAARRADRLDRAARALTALAQRDEAEARLAALPERSPPAGALARLEAAEAAVAAARAERALVAPPDPAAPPPGVLRARADEVRRLAARAPAAEALVARRDGIAPDAIRAREALERALAGLAAVLGADAAGEERLPDAPGPETWDGLRTRAGRVVQARADAVGAAPAGPDEAAVPGEEGAEGDLDRLAALRLDLAHLDDLERRPARPATSAPPAALASGAGAVALFALAGWLAHGRATVATAAASAVVAVGLAVLAWRLRRAGVVGVDPEVRALAATVAAASVALGGPARPGQVDLQAMEARARSGQDARDGRRRRADLQAAEEAFDAAARAAGLPPFDAAAVDLVRARLELALDARARLGETREALDDTVRELSRFAAEVSAIDPDGPAVEPDQAPGRARLAESARLRAEAEARAVEREAQAQAALAALLDAAGAPDGETLRRWIADDAARQEAGRQAQAARDALAALGADEGLEAVARSLAAMDGPGRTQALAEAAQEAAAAAQAAEEALGDLRVLDADAARLRQGSAVSEGLQVVAEREAEVVEAASAWAQAALARWLLDRAKARYEEERQPATLRAASELFVLLTQGRYERVVRPADGGAPRVVRADGERLETQALSHGTRAQLYLALRLALADDYARRVTALPIVLDDVLVAFDDGRRSAAVAALAALGARGRQVLLFTCHRAGLDEAQAAGARIVRLERLAPPGVAAAGRPVAG